MSEVEEDGEGIQEDISANGVTNFVNEYEGSSKFSGVFSQSEQEPVLESGRSRWLGQNTSSKRASEEQVSLGFFMPCCSLIQKVY